jgi:hypothetical protein
VVRLPAYPAHPLPIPENVIDGWPLPSLLLPLYAPGHYAPSQGRECGMSAPPRHFVVTGIGHPVDVRAPYETGHAPTLFFTEPFRKKTSIAREKIQKQHPISGEVRCYTCDSAGK